MFLIGGDVGSGSPRVKTMCVTTYILADPPLPFIIITAIVADVLIFLPLWETTIPLHGLAHRFSSSHG
jgi:hypothetical protein